MGILQFDDSRPYTPILTDYAVALQQDRKNLLAVHELFERAETGVSGQVYLRGDAAGMGFVPDLNLRRAPGSEFARVKMHGPSYGSFSVPQFGLEIEVEDEYRDESMIPGDLYLDAVNENIDSVLVDRDYREAAFVQDNTRWTTYNVTTSSTPFDAPGARPMNVLLDRLNAFKLRNKGAQPDTMIFGPVAAYALQKAEQFRDYGSVIVDRSAPVRWDDMQARLSAAMGIPAPRIVIAEGMRRSSALGLSVTLARNWGDFIWFGKLQGGNPTPVEGGVRVGNVAAFAAVRRKKTSSEAPLAAKTMDAGSDLTVSVYREENKTQDVVRVAHQGAVVGVKNSLGELLEDVSAAA